MAIVGDKDAGVSDLMTTVGRFMDIMDINTHSLGLEVETFGKIEGTGRYFGLNLVEIVDLSLLYQQPQVLDEFQGVMFVFPLTGEVKEDNLVVKVAKKLQERKETTQVLYFVANKLEAIFRKGYEPKIITEKFPFFPAVKFLPVSPHHAFNMEYLFTTLIHELYNRNKPVDPEDN